MCKMIEEEVKKLDEISTTQNTVEQKCKLPLWIWKKQIKNIGKKWFRT